MVAMDQMNTTTVFGGKENISNENDLEHKQKGFKNSTIGAISPHHHVRRNLFMYTYYYN